MKCILIFAAALFAGTAYGQRSVDDVLREVEAASKELKAQRELTAAQKMEAQTGKYLANPSVEFESLWGGAERIRNSELTVMQAFDFPSAYASRNKIAKLRSSYYDTEGAALRQQLLLDAKTLCIQIVHLNRMKEFLSERVVNAERLDSAYRRKFGYADRNRKRPVFRSGLSDRGEFACIRTTERAVYGAKSAGAKPAAAGVGR